jgi:hypothetical protein
MRTVLGYVNGKPQWSDNVPANPGASSLKGSLVSGAHGPVEQARINSRRSAEAYRERRDTKVTM